MNRGNDALTVVILAAGEGKRMGPGRVKVLAEICGRSSIAYPLKAASSLNPNSTVIVVGSNGEAIQNALKVESALLAGVEFGDIKFVTQENPQGTGHAARCALDALGDISGDVLLLYGDGPLVTEELVTKLVLAHRDSQANASMVTVYVDQPEGYGRVVRNETGEFQRIVEEKDASPEIKSICEINTGIGCFKASALRESLLALKSDNSQGEYYLTDVFGMEASNGALVSSVFAEDDTEVLGFNSPEELGVVRDIMRRRIIDRHLAAGVDILAPETVYIEDTVEIGVGTRILPFCVMSGEVKIGQNCYVGPMANLRGGAVLHDRAEIGNFVEMKNSTLGEGSKAKHLTYLGDTVVGKKSNIGAGTITANYDGKTKSPTKIGDGTFIGSGTVLVAPVNVGDGAYTGARSLILKGRDVPSHTVVVGSPAKLLERRRDTEDPGPKTRGSE